MHHKARKIVPILVVLAAAILGWAYFSSQKAKAGPGALTASGTVEADQTILSPELSGKVAEVLVKEGDSVLAGQVVVRFDEDLLRSQLQQAEAALAMAQANYNLVAAGPTPEQRQVNLTTARLEVTSAQQALQDLYDKANLAAAQARQAVASADKARDLATQRLDNMESNADQADIDEAQATVVLARDRLDHALEDYAPYEKKPEDNLVRARLQAKQADAQKKYDAAVTRLNNLLGTSNRYDLAVAEADKALAESRLADAQREYDKVKDGPDPDALALAEERLANAKAHLAAAEADPSPEQLAVAQAQVESAKASLQVLNTQMEKLVLAAPLDGVVLVRSVEPGEVSLPGAPLLTLARLDSLTITIYVSEDRYGEISLGQVAQVKVDSFPGEVFTGRVIYIADQAEFTPRNVQTAQGRRTTVYALKLSIENPQSMLKPGMPADVTFGNS